MLEVELKFRAPSVPQLTAALESLGAARNDPVEQLDLYFAHPSRDFAATDEALRIRRVGSSNFITYKGPKIDTATKTRREIELPLTSGHRAAADFGELLLALGFREVAQVKKSRTSHHLSWHGNSVEVVIDQVDELGTFVEIETVCDNAELESARAAILALAEELGLEASERRSYLEMLLAAKGGEVGQGLQIVN